MRNGAIAILAYENLGARPLGENVG